MLSAEGEVVVEEEEETVRKAVLSRTHTSWVAGSAGRVMGRTFWRSAVVDDC